MNREFTDRLVKHLNFLEEELKDYSQFKELTREGRLRYPAVREKRKKGDSQETPSRNHTTCGARGVVGLIS